VTEENNFLLMRERDSELVIRISGTWRLKDGLPSMDGVKKEIERPPHLRLVLFNTQELAGWDSSVVCFLAKVSELCREIGIPVDWGKLPKGLRRLVELAEAALVAALSETLSDFSREIADTILASFTPKD
jgi:phospholipid/cholesterol/gamma-HCH transport system permease protein